MTDPSATNITIKAQIYSTFKTISSILFKIEASLKNQKTVKSKKR